MHSAKPAMEALAVRALMMGVRTRRRILASEWLGWIFASGVLGAGEG